MIDESMSTTATLDADQDSEGSEEPELATKTQEAIAQEILEADQQELRELMMDFPIGYSLPAEKYGKMRFLLRQIAINGKTLDIEPQSISKALKLRAKTILQRTMRIKADAVNAVDSGGVRESTFEIMDQEAEALLSIANEVGEMITIQDNITTSFPALFKEAKQVNSRMSVTTGVATQYAAFSGGGAEEAVLADIVDKELYVSPKCRVL